ncbi:putative undecaprenyl diphosphate synthase-domain-containing protein [Peziza echinospora]|nr:putative undecaprenyl diphosphate synthase-domain-containing protein [Peziza echinospora]
MSGPHGSSKAKKWLLSSPPIEWGVTMLQSAFINSVKQGPVPQHVAFVMDGNRRYARKSHLETAEGHSLGFEALARILEICYKSGVKAVTVYAFSIENFKRSKYEVDALMDIAKIKLHQLSQHGDLMDRYGASIRVLGQTSMVSPDVLEEIERATEMTKHNTKAILNICFPYTSRDEITTSIRNIVSLSTAPPPSPPASPLHSDSSDNSSSTHTSATATANHLSSSPPYADIESITEQTIEDHLFTNGSPPLDLLIRTSGVQRLSDFMLWQCHKDTEIEFVDVLWPDFDLWTFLPILINWGIKRKKTIERELREEAASRRRDERGVRSKGDVKRGTAKKVA